MKKGQILEGVVEYTAFPNKGVVRTEEGRIVVKNTLPGQTVKCCVNKVRKGKGEGRLLEVTVPAPGETESSCVHFGVCGGCTYQSLPYEAQLKLKEGQVRSLLEEVVAKYENRVSPDWFEGIKASPRQFGYRNKMEFSFGDSEKDGPLALGMHKRGSFYDIVSVKHCQIVDEDYRKILSCTLSYFTGKETPFYHKRTHRGFLRHLLVRKAVKTGEILVDLVTSSQTPPPTICLERGLLEDYTQELMELKLDGAICGILHTVNDREADVVQNDGTEILYGRDYFYEELLGLRFKITPFSFFQTNSLGAELLYETAREYIGDVGNREQVIFDLYSGTGTIAQMMAPVAKKVIGVEIVEEAVHAARENAELNELYNCEFIAGDVLKVIDSIEEKPDFIILDPPRDGIHPKALPKIIGYGVERILYISCKPTSLARDLAMFFENGYCLERAVAVDMFPGTTGIETVVMLSHKKPTV
ncbi:23S rRNA (uracil(1939)-C(5))-methyltransferase RlmD [bacterium C-53]|nr:23S rRNA (uracil(1939)-C(5))-methyltransferase RlmD [Lachnospiraceae bacterium]NBI02464.1 23S rRNA (uracil(1939)-C(5))-methyltransferase RlmD [Lachnospiraceae bacterium]RKJ11564.1 23S rRNA (uracil(1939)-C(5))-methyltransferase RlmD [bacterium C-53]